MPETIIIIAFSAQHEVFLKIISFCHDYDPDEICTDGAHTLPHTAHTLQHAASQFPSFQRKSLYPSNEKEW